MPAPGVRGPVAGCRQTGSQCTAGATSGGAVAQNGRTQGRRRTAGLPQPPESGLSEERPQTGLCDTGVVHNFSPSGSLRQFRDREGLEGHPGTAEEAGPGLWSWRERLVLHVQTEQCCLAAVQTDTPGRLPPTTWRKTDHYNKGYFTYLQTDYISLTTLEGSSVLALTVTPRC